MAGTGELMPENSAEKSQWVNGGGEAEVKVDSIQRNEGETVRDSQHTCIFHLGQMETLGIFPAMDSTHNGMKLSC